jgi:phosphatase NudJ
MELLMENLKLISNKGFSSPHGQDQFKPNTTVAAIIHHQGKFLLVEEYEDNSIVFNQPAGHLEKNESILTALKREVFEETGLKLSPEYLSGIYYFYKPDVDLYFLRFCFVIEVNKYLTGNPQDKEIIANHWLTLEQINTKHKQLRSHLVLECINDYLAGNKIPLTHLKTNL